MKLAYKENPIPVLGKGFVRYINHLGTDSTIVEAARVSYGSESKGEEQDKKLLFYLYRQNHSSPFEQANLTLNIKLPLFVQAQLVRHRTARLNQISARYTEMAEEFYIPKEWRKQDTKNKQGSFATDDWNEKDYCCGVSKNEILKMDLETHCNDSYELYKEMIETGVAREMARMVLPQNLYTEIRWNIDLNNLMKFFRLRLDSHAQFEIQEYARAMYVIFKDLYPWCAEAFEKYKFVVQENG